MGKKARVRFRSGGAFHCKGMAEGCARPGVLDGTDGKGVECLALPSELIADDEKAAAFLAFAAEVYERDPPPTADEIRSEWKARMEVPHG